MLPATGVITGSVDDDAALAALAAVDGVAAVEPAQEIVHPAARRADPVAEGAVDPPRRIPPAIGDR